MQKTFVVHPLAKFHIELRRKIRQTIWYKSLIYTYLQPLLVDAFYNMPYRFFLNSFIALILSYHLTAQQGGVNSPFSRYGIGDLETENSIHSQQMGGIGTALTDAFHLNFDNPASVAFLKATAFDLGLNMKYAKLDDEVNQSNQWSGNLSSLSMGFPLRNPLNEIFSRDDYEFNWGMGVSLMPHSTVSYNINSVDSIGETGNFTRNFNGNGGTYKAMWTNAVRYKDFAFGVNVGYLFGKIDYERNIDFLESFNAYDNQFTSSYSLRGLYLKLGAIYSITLNDAIVSDDLGTEQPNILNIGLSWRPNTSFSTVADISQTNFYPVAILSPPVDTFFVATGLAGKGTHPGEIGIGINYSHSNTFSLGIDYRTTLWSKYKNEANPEILNDTWRIAFGGYYRPDFDDITNILKRAYYRVGIYYEKDPRSLNSSEIKNYGLSLGFGFPFAWQRKFSHMNIGLNLGKRSAAGILSENYIRVNFGFTFNDNEWFIKRKYN